VQLHHLFLINICTTTPLTKTTTMEPSNTIDRITANAKRDDIDLTCLPFCQEAFDSIQSLTFDAQQLDTSQLDFSQAGKIDAHTHPIPPWFHALEPMAAGRATPEWSVEQHLEFMSTRGIKRSILSVSTPQGNAFNDVRNEEERKRKTVALARLLNEYVSEVCRLWPDRFDWLAVTTLPYVGESVVEVQHAMKLGAIGVTILTNAEGRYPGDEKNDRLWEYLNSKSGKEVVFIHPTEPVIKLDDGRIISSRPCRSIPSLLVIQSQECRPNNVRNSPPPLRPRRILLRNRARNIQHHLFPHPPEVPKPPLAHIPRCRRFSRYLRALFTRFSRHFGLSSKSIQGAILVR
jgi:predicted TIM-barrel fold metal-dependent hydrolase